METKKWKGRDVVKNKVFIKMKKILYMSINYQENEEDFIIWMKVVMDKLFEEVNAKHYADKWGEFWILYTLSCYVYFVHCSSKHDDKG